MPKVKTNFVSLSMEEFLEMLEEYDEEVIILGNEGFQFGDICRRCGDIKPHKAIFLYPSSFGDVDPYELGDELESALSDKEVTCQHDTIFCTCRFEKDEEDDYGDSSDYL